jgi:hypothetical protein
MGKLKKEVDEQGHESARFQTREVGLTVASFPQLNPRALAMTIGVLSSKLEQKSKPKNERQRIANQSIKLEDPEFQALLSTESFSKIYAQFLIEMPEYSAEGLQEVRGQWVVYPQGSDATPLVKSLEGFPLEWCTADFDTAQTQLQGGDFHVYYSINEAGEAVIPRAAIRMEDQSIAEVRGIAGDQNIDPYIAPVVAAKMKEFPDGAVYEKKAADMKALTALEQKNKAGKLLDKADLRFLYEIDSPVEGFGYQKDPRLAELRSDRDSHADMLEIFECDDSQIARSVDQINQTTKAFVGPLEPGIFDHLPDNLEHIYTSFPEGRIRREQIEIGGQTTAELEAALQQGGFVVYAGPKDMMHCQEFTTLKESEEIKLVRLSVADLGFPNGATVNQVFERAEVFGLELCPAEVGPQYRLQYTTQPMDEWVLVGTKPIAGSGGLPYVFSVVRHPGGAELDGGWAEEPGNRWNAHDQMLFRLRKKSLEP